MTCSVRKAMGERVIFLGHPKDTPDEFNPAHALMFWLVGFSNDPADPFAGHRERMKGDDLARRLFTPLTRRTSASVLMTAVATVDDDEPDRQEITIRTLTTDLYSGP